MLSYHEALEIVLRTVTPLPPEEITLYEALGKVLAAPENSRWDLPPADNSAMDGYAFAATDLKPGDELTVSDFIPAGRQSDVPLVEGHAVKIMTGAPVPQGCDTVVPVEEVQELPGRIRLTRPPVRGSHIRRRGQELRRGDLLVASGTPLSAGEMAVLAAGGAERVLAYPAPSVAVLSTGDELVDLGKEPGPGQIVNSNFHLLAANLRLAGASVMPLGIARDTRKDLEMRLEQGLAADMLITTGGVSVGDRDLVQETLIKMGFERKFWKARIKPGKPVLFGTVRNKPVFGLPGNPAATAVTFELFVRPALRLMTGFRAPLPSRRRAVLGETVRGDAKREHFLWGTLEERGRTCCFHPSSSQNSGQNRSFLGADALLPLPPERGEVAAGSEVEVLQLRMPTHAPKQYPNLLGLHASDQSGGFQPPGAEKRAS